jgi:hypothetical protein
MILAISAPTGDITGLRQLAEGILSGLLDPVFCSEGASSVDDFDVEDEQEPNKIKTARKTSVIFIIKKIIYNLCNNSKQRF